MTSTIHITIAKKKNLYRVKRWGEDAIMRDYYQRDVNQLDISSNFQVIQLYVPGTETWSAITNHVVLGREEMDFLIALNSIYGYPGATNTFESLMNWLVCDCFGTRPYWNGRWDSEMEFHYGTMLWGNQTVEIIGEKVIKTTTPGNNKYRYIPMGLVRMFTKKDFQIAKRFDTLPIQTRITPITHPELIPQCASVGQNNVFNPHPKGFTMFSPIWGTDWKNNFKTHELYIPFECLVKIP